MSYYNRILLEAVVSPNHPVDSWYKDADTTLRTDSFVQLGHLPLDSALRYGIT